MTRRFDADAICRRIDARSLESLEVLPRVGSTNNYLMDAAAPGAGRWRAVIAEHQTQGRGQRGHTWVSPPGSGLCMSLAYTFTSEPASLAPLSLAIGGAIVGRLRRLGAADVGLKWPNDIVLPGGKLGGVLIETRAAHGGNHTVVVGLGLNMDLRASSDEMQLAVPEYDIADLAQCMGQPIVPDLLAARMLESIVTALLTFDAKGFAAFREAWSEFDCLRGKHVVVKTSTGSVKGVASGIDDNGALLVNTGNGISSVISGSVNVAQKTEVVA